MLEVEQLVNTDHLWQLAREGTGKGVRVAILDTGVEAEHPALQGSVKTCYDVVVQGRRPEVVEANPGDPVGHGTACAGIIHELAPEAELYSVRVIGSNASGTVDQLVAGMQWAVEQKMEVINLSLGTVQRRMEQQIRELVDRAYFEGLIMVGAANNQNLPSFPSDLAALVGVDNQSFKDPMQFNFRLGQAVEVVAHGIYVNAPAPGGKFRLFTGTSFACPHVTGLVARLRSTMPELRPFHVKTLLWCLRHNRGAPPEPQAT